MLEERDFDEILNMIDLYRTDRTIETPDMGPETLFLTQKPAPSLSLTHPPLRNIYETLAHPGRSNISSIRFSTRCPQVIDRPSSKYLYIDFNPPPNPREIHGRPLVDFSIGRPDNTGQTMLENIDTEIGE